MEMLASLLPIILMFVLLYFILIRPQQKRQKQVREMQAELKKGDSVVTIGGFHGEIHAMDEDTIVIQAGDGSKLTYDRSAIREVKQQ
ncbi:MULTISPECIES: preprotein translocase subunit YajC [Bacillota]|uniref:Preprotein translocase subunit YajC n=1 Tax=Virgibacillus pantothenticus TaxID=1473 RepID=A0A0L0QPQ4_VIRPA|nr:MULTISPECIES: preprotein translocase subunit YajC [Bacillota]API90651.1 preprotein translocase subunit YajC [Virgibacillus sp. 6R]KNE20605.1 preprotein translocase subunit YajC [Virgibacillus pantothenticus]MBS7429772.1 preprotein translocase subunit YajC [Virgibacillus sp. 19R1-5]MBU8565647.1 preprotein translocase subunit YajC [Virgibacillus pantothenticus]MBU8601271.1 preprotein translocase subunit YajC [Virgibacillus pantothenticus]